MLNFYGSFFTLIILVDKYSPIDSHCEPSMLSSCVVKRRVVRPWPWPCVSGLGFGLVQSQGQGQSDQYSSKHSVSRYNYNYSTLVYQRHWYRHSASPSTVWYYSVISLRMPWSLALVLALRPLALALRLLALALRLPALLTSLVKRWFWLYCVRLYDLPSGQFIHSLIVCPILYCFYYCFFYFIPFVYFFCSLYFVYFCIL